MPVVFRITEMFPKLGVLASGNVTINNVVKIRDVQLTSQNSRRKYKVIIPKSVGILGSELLEIITDVIIYEFEKGNKLLQGGKSHE
jgi:uncharacterized metal-binding protein